MFPLTEGVGNRRHSRHVTGPAHTAAAGRGAALLGEAGIGVGRGDLGHVRALVTVLRSTAVSAFAVSVMVLEHASEDFSAVRVFDENGQIAPVARALPGCASAKAASSPAC